MEDFLASWQLSPDTTMPQIAHTALFSGLFLICLNALKRAGYIQWEYRRHRPTTLRVAWHGRWLLVTAGGFAFTSDLRKLFALDAKTGVELWSLETGSISAAPITYRVGGRQYLTVAASDLLVTFGLPDPDSAQPTNYKSR